MHLWCQGGAYLNPDFLRDYQTGKSFFLEIGNCPIGGTPCRNWFSHLMSMYIIIGGLGTGGGERVIWAMIKRKGVFLGFPNSSSSTGFETNLGQPWDNFGTTMRPCDTPKADYLMTKTQFFYFPFNYFLLENHLQHMPCLPTSAKTLVLPY